MQNWHRQFNNNELSTIEQLALIPMNTGRSQSCFEGISERSQGTSRVLQGITGSSRESQAFQGVSWAFQGVSGSTTRYRRHFKDVLVGFRECRRISRGLEGLRGVSGSLRRLQRGTRRSQGVHLCRRGISAGLWGVSKGFREFQEVSGAFQGV